MERIKYMGQIENDELSSIIISVQIKRVDLKNLQYILQKYCERTTLFNDIREAVQLETEIRSILKQSADIHDSYE